MSVSPLVSPLVSPPVSPCHNEIYAVDQIKEPEASPSSIMSPPGNALQPHISNNVCPFQTQICLPIRSRYAPDTPPPPSTAMPSPTSLPPSSPAMLRLHTISCAFTSSFLPPFPSNRPLSVQPRPTPSLSIVASVPKLPAFRRPIVPAKPLHLFVEDRAQTRADVVRSFTTYVKQHNLQDPSDRRIINCDQSLKTILGVDKCTFLQLPKFLSPHLSKPEEVGGRYVEEATLLEETLLKHATPKDVKKMRKRSISRRKGAEADRKAGRHLFRPLILSKELVAICRVPELQRQQVIKSVWKYIHMNNLSQQGTSGNPIKCDFLLKQIYNADFINARTVISGISTHVTKKE